MDKKLGQATDQEQALHIKNTRRMLPISLLKIDEINNYHLTIWFWRTKANCGYYHARCFNFSWRRNIWKRNNVKPFWGYRDNGAKKANNDTCLDATIGLGYLQLNYVNWDLQCNQN